MTDDIPIEAQLVRDGLAPELEIVDTKIEPTFGDDDFHVRIEMRIEEELHHKVFSGFEQSESCGDGMDRKQTKLDRCRSF